MDNVSPEDVKSVENVAQELVSQLVTKSDLMIEKRLTVEDIQDEPVGASVSNAEDLITSATNDESKIDVTEVFEAADSYQEVAEASPAENSVEAPVESAEAPGESKIDVTSVFEASDSYTLAMENLPAGVTESAESGFFEAAKEVEVVAHVQTDAPQPEGIAIEEVPNSKIDVTDVFEASDSYTEQDVPEFSPAETPQMVEMVTSTLVEVTESTANEEPTEAVESRASVTEKLSTVGMTDSRMISEVFRNTAGIEEGLKEADEVAAKEAEIREAAKEVATEAVESAVELIEAPEVADAPVETVQTVEIVEECAPAENSNVVISEAPAEIPAELPTEVSPGLGNNLMGVGICVSSPSRRDISPDDWVIEDASTNPESAPEAASGECEVAI